MVNFMKTSKLHGIIASCYNYSPKCKIVNFIKKSLRAVQCAVLQEIKVFLECFVHHSL